MEATPQAMQIALERALSRFTIDELTGCWLWTASVNPRGYGLTSIPQPGHNLTRRAHRFIYEALVGAIPEGLDLDHLCRVRRCVNPDHLEPVTHQENCQRVPREVCAKGHPREDALVWILRGKQIRVCRECRRNNSQTFMRSRAKARCPECRNLKPLRKGDGLMAAHSYTRKSGGVRTEVRCSGVGQPPLAVTG